MLDFLWEAKIFGKDLLLGFWLYLWIVDCVLGNLLSSSNFVSYNFWIVILVFVSLDSLPIILCSVIELFVFYDPWISIMDSSVLISSFSVFHLVFFCLNGSKSWLHLQSLPNSFQELLSFPYKWVFRCFWFWKLVLLVYLLEILRHFLLWFMVRCERDWLLLRMSFIVWICV